MVFMMRDICCPVISSWSCIKDHQIHTLTGHVRNTQNCTPEVEIDSVAWNGTVGAHFLKMSLCLDFLHPAAITVKFISHLLLEEVGECLCYYGHFWVMILNDLNFWYVEIQFIREICPWSEAKRSRYVFVNSVRMLWSTSYLILLW